MITILQFDVDLREVEVEPHIGNLQHTAMSAFFFSIMYTFFIHSSLVTQMSEEVTIMQPYSKCATRFTCIITGNQVMTSQTNKELIAEFWYRLVR
jgi:imidazoleglycerol phosphate synthase glutamine amidotransferase subunit HisH